MAAHPDSPAGGGGSGFSRPPGPKGMAGPSAVRNHPDAPATRHFNDPLERARRQHEISRQVRRIATDKEVEDFRQNPLSPHSVWLLIKGLKLYAMDDTTLPQDRSGLINYNISIVTGNALGLGDKTTRKLAGDDVPWKEVRKETPQNLMAFAGFALKALQELQQFASASKGFRAWLAEADAQRLSQPLAELNSSTAAPIQGLYDGPAELARGNFGERAATEALAADGHTILDYKPGIAGTNQGGIDMVTLKNGMVHFIDNKALTRSGNVNSVTALTTNFAQNRASVVAQFTRYAQDAARPAAERAMFQRAIDDINAGRFVRVVTNANLVQGNTKILSGVSQRLRTLGIQFIDVMR